MRLCIVRGWHTQWEVWRRIGTAWIGAIAPLPVCDHTMDTRIARRKVAVLAL